MWRSKASMDRRKALADIAIETKELTPTISAQLPELNLTDSDLVDLASLSPLDPGSCPGFLLNGESSKTGTVIRVFNKDALDTAISMPGEILDLELDKHKDMSVDSQQQDGTPDISKGTTTRMKEAVILNKLRGLASHPENLNPATAPRVAVLNMASEFNPGGGWLRGSVAQEEAICYRSTLAASLPKEKYYPIAARTGVYTRDVVIVRSSMGDGHDLLVPETPVEELPIYSALTVAGMRRPAVKAVDENGNAIEEEKENITDGGNKDGPPDSANGSVGVQGDATSSVSSDAAQSSENTSRTGSEGNDSGRRPNRSDRKRYRKGKKSRMDFIFANEEDKDLTRDKMRLCLRMAASKGHTMLVLGAMGCGAFRNPPKEIASCWMEVLEEEEFSGGWFKEVWFAVFDRKREGNFEVFEERFDGKIIGARTKEEHGRQRSDVD